MAFEPAGREELAQRFVDLTGVAIPAELAVLWSWWDGQRIRYSEEFRGSGDRLPGGFEMQKLEDAVEQRDRERDFEIEHEFEHVPGWFASGDWLPIMWEQGAIVWADLASVDQEGRVRVEIRLSEEFQRELTGSFSCIADLLDSMSYLLEQRLWKLFDSTSFPAWTVEAVVEGHEWVNR